MNLEKNMLSNGHSRQKIENKVSFLLRYLKKDNNAMLKTHFPKKTLMPTFQLHLHFFLFNIKKLCKMFLQFVYFNSQCPVSQGNNSFLILQIILKNRKSENTDFRSSNFSDKKLISKKGNFLKVKVFFSIEKFPKKPLPQSFNQT